MDLQNTLKFLHVAEGLKRELRHSWLSDGRQESVAEHTWRVALMAMAIEEYLPQKVNSERLLKMIIIHDLVEVYATDIPAFDTMNNIKVKEQKRQNEMKAIEKIRNLLGNDTGQQFYDLWFEFEHKKTYEAKVANALDKLEAQIQHNEAAIETWLPIEHEMVFLLGKHTDFDDVLGELKGIIEAEGIEKIQTDNKL
ncbi:HD domain-containing protein [Lysinibacillus pakistanensis]|uniref:HD domain-containing protein n=1 Tax=Lysinibacillus pakistanensis TaxID=759811 RepID=A0AAX3WX31_9BACI|nr:HD domain-containing protein [Lysinibacillus pakistanensis]MDM5230736.1 HD domain-containing protein [Lysinibacillus pakistanensis]WHY46307.1 HD domain-containing protein [Lysinibacillus pakistanensis]WHY51319.1 HD domain-containing protein [Lysinibacillus pakistanensis]